MQYQPEKFLNAAVFFARNTDPKIFGVTKLMKLLFFSDFLHYERYGRPIVGDQYYHLPEGPVPTTSYDLWKGTIRGEKTGLEEYVKIIEEPVSNHKIFRIEALKDFNENVFSDSDLEVMQEVAKEFFDVTGTSLAEKTHAIPFVKETPRVYQIDYVNAVKDDEDRKYIIELQKEDEEVESALLRS